MAVVLLPFTLLVALVDWQRADPHRRGPAGDRSSALYRLVDRRHPRFLARIRPTQLALWSFAIATAHGAGLMLLPIYLGLCRRRVGPGGGRGAASLVGRTCGMAIAVSAVHSAAMIAAGGVVRLARLPLSRARAISREAGSTSTPPGREPRPRRFGLARRGRHGRALTARRTIPFATAVRQAKRAGSSERHRATAAANINGRQERADASVVRLVAS